MPACEWPGGCEHDPRHQVPDGVPVFKLYDLSGDQVLGWYCRGHAQARVRQVGEELRAARGQPPGGPGVMDEHSSLPSTRWAVRVDLLDGLVVDNWGVLTLDDQRHVNRLPFDQTLPPPAWELVGGAEGRVPTITRVPGHLHSISYLPVPPALISLDPAREIEPQPHTLLLFPYLFVYRGGAAQILAAFTPDLSTWWIGRITVSDGQPTTQERHTMSQNTRCVECQAEIAICDHAVQRLLDPERSFSAGRVEATEAENARLTEQLGRAMAALAEIARHAEQRAVRTLAASTLNALAAAE